MPIGTSAPDVVAEDPAGQPVRLSEVVVHFLSRRRHARLHEGSVRLS